MFSNMEIFFLQRYSSRHWYPNCPTLPRLAWKSPNFCRQWFEFDFSQLFSYKYKLQAQTFLSNLSVNRRISRRPFPTAALTLCAGGKSSSLTPWTEKRDLFFLKGWRGGSAWWSNLFSYIALSLFNSPRKGRWKRGSLLAGNMVN